MDYAMIGRAPSSTERASEANPSRMCLLVVVTCLVVWAAFLPSTFTHNLWIYSWDSAAYVETANSIHAGRGLMQRVIYGLEPNIWEPISLWPPGYSLLIAAIQLIGLPPTTSCVGVSIAAGAFSVILLAIICLRLFHWALALPLVVTIVVTPAFQQISTQCMSDTSYFAFVVASVICVMQWARKPQASLFWIFGAGLCAGAAWGTRNVGLALFAATGILLVSQLLYWRFGQVFKTGLVWLIGVAVCALPLVIHNLVTFGRINPYSMPPSELSLWANVRRASTVIVYDMTTSTVATNWIVDKYKFPLCVLAALVFLVSWIWRTSFPQMRMMFERQQVQIFLIAYAVIYTGMVIMARTKYRWGEEIDPRHMVQVYWILWICVAAWGSALFKYYRVRNHIAKSVLICVFFITSSLQIHREWKLLTLPPYRPEAIETRVGMRACTFLAREIGQNQIVLSTRADLLRIHCDINARKVPPVSQYDFLSPVIRDDINRVGQSGFLWGLVIVNIEAAKKGDFGTLVKDIIERPKDYPELQRVSIESPAIILRYVGNGHAAHE